MRRITALVLLISLIVGSFFFVACSKGKEQKGAGEMAEHGMRGQWKFTLPQGDVAEGRRIFIEAECYKCHEVKGETFPAVAKAEKGVGPELSQMAGMHQPSFLPRRSSTLTR